MAKPIPRTDCTGCDGRCCNYATVKIDTPRSPADIDEVRWFLVHDKLSVYIEDGVWFLQFHTPCRHLTAEGRCGIHPNRFLICRQHEAKDCENSGRPLPETLFHDLADFDKWWLAKRIQSPERKRICRPGPTG